MLFAFKKCDKRDPTDSSGLDCEDEDILNDFIKSLTVEVWSISEKLFYNNTLVNEGIKPVFNSINLISQSLIDPYKLTETQVYKRDNLIKTNENYFNIGIFGNYFTFYDVEKIH